MDVIQLKNSLEKIIAILPGSRDREGSPIIVFPSHGDFVEYPFAEVVSVISYLSQIPDDKSRNKGFTVLIDMRRSYIKYLKIILKAVQHVLYGRVRQVIIVKPEHFIEKQRINIDLKLEVYEYKIHFVSAHKLTRHIELGQLPIAFAGSYPYDHKKWLDLRMRYESFLKDGSNVLRQVEILENPNLSREEKTKRISSEFSDKTSIPLIVEDLLKRGQKLVLDLKGETDDGVAIKSANPDYILASGRVETLMQQLKSDREQLSGRTFDQTKVDKEKNEKILYEQFLIGVNNISEWLLGPGEKWLLTLHEIGESRDESEQLKRDHDQLHQKTQEILSQVSDVKLMADELLASNDPQRADVMKKRDYLDSVSKAFSTRVKRQRQIIQMSFSFHSLVDEYSAKLDELLDSLCSDTAANDVPSSENSIQILDVRLNAIEKAYVEVMMEGQNFLDHLQVREQNSLGYEVTRDYLPGIVHVRRTLGELQDRKQRSNQLADVRRLKLQQILQLFTCERDADQAIKWLYELCETLAYQYTKIGTTPNEVSAVRKDHQKLEQTARSTYEYGKQLMQVSLVLRRSLRYEMAKNYELSQRLDEAWAKFCKALSERATRLNISQVFYSTIKQVNSRLEDLCSAVNEDNAHQNVNANVSGMAVDSGRNSRMEQYDSVHKQLVSEVRELKYMAQALIERMEQPVVSLPGSMQKDIAYVDKKAMEEIRHRLSQVETKSKMLDDYFTEENNTATVSSPMPSMSNDLLVRDMRLLDVHENRRKD